MIQYTIVQQSLVPLVGYIKAGILGYIHASISSKANSNELIDGKAWCYDTYETMCQYFGISVRSIKTYFKELIEDGYLEVSRLQKSNLDMTNYYTLTDISQSHFMTVARSKNKQNKIISHNYSKRYKHNICDSAEFAPCKVHNLHDGECNNCTMESAGFAPSSYNTNTHTNTHTKILYGENQFSPLENDFEEDTIFLEAQKTEEKKPKKDVIHTPTKQEIYEFLAEKTNDTKLSRRLSEEICSYYELSSWHKSNGSKIRYWKQAVAGWLSRDKHFGTHSPPRHTSSDAGIKEF